MGIVQTIYFLFIISFWLSKNAGMQRRKHIEESLQLNPSYYLFVLN